MPYPIPAIRIGKAVDCAAADGRALVAGVVVPLAPLGAGRAEAAEAEAAAEALATRVAVEVGAAAALADGCGAWLGGGGVAVALLPPPHAASNVVGTAQASINCKQRRRPNPCMIRSAPCINRARSAGDHVRGLNRHDSTTPTSQGSTFSYPNTITTVDADGWLPLRAAWEPTSQPHHPPYGPPTARVQSASSDEND